MTQAHIKATQESANAAVSHLAAGINAAKIAKLRKHAKDAKDAHQAIVAMCPCFEHVVKKDFGAHTDIPKNMMNVDSGGRERM